MFIDQAVFLVFAAIVILLFIRAWRHGVVGMLWGMTGALAGILTGLAAYGIFVKSLNLSNPMKAGACFVIGLIGYAIVRQFAKGTLMRLFGKEGPLHFFRDRLGGGLVSLVPSVITIGIISMSLRIGGTLTDLDRFETLSIDGVDFLEPDYPRRSPFAWCRDGAEHIAPVGEALDLLDPVCPVAERNLAALLITTKKEALFDALSEDPETGRLLASPAFSALMEDAEVGKLNEASRHVALMRHPKVQQAALDPAIRPALKELELHRTVDAFMLSPARQEVVKSFTRPEKME